MDFSQKDLANRWRGVKGVWELIQGETKQFVRRRGYRNGSYARDLLTSYGWLEGLVVPRVREGGFQPLGLERYHCRQRAVDRVLLETFLKAMDLGAHLVNRRHRHRIIADALHIFGASTETEARRRLRGFTDTWTEKES
jgi:hypothetical protein